MNFWVQFLDGAAIRLPIHISSVKAASKQLRVKARRKRFAVEQLEALYSLLDDDGSGSLTVHEMIVRPPRPNTPSCFRRNGTALRAVMRAPAKARAFRRPVRPRRPPPCR